MTRRTRLAIAMVAGWIAASAAAAAYAVGASDGGARVALGPGHAAVTLHIEHSRFTPARIDVRPGTHVVFTLVNHDPITHELIVGDDEVHAVHAAGTHGSHGALPGEVSVEPGERARTSFTFDEPGTVLFACHLPRHFEYGMVGEVRVRGG